jgi:hypothetical protein
MYAKITHNVYIKLFSYHLSNIYWYCSFLEIISQDSSAENVFICAGVQPVAELPIDTIMIKSEVIGSDKNMPKYPSCRWNLNQQSCKPSI